MEHISIKDFQKGMQINGIYILKNHSMAETSTKKKYLNFTIQDQSGEISGKMWNADSFDDNSIVDADFVTLTCSVDEYNGKLQIIAESIIYTPMVTDVTGLVPVSPQNPNDLWNELQIFINTLESPYKTIVIKALEPLEKQFKVFPAAKGVHHDFIYGLLQHTVGMARLANSISNLYDYLGIINRSLLLSATILHDIAKTAEFKVGKVGLVEDYTNKGNLLGHLYMGANYIREICIQNNVPDNICMLLQHMILSHHGEPEYGACVKPQFIEAHLLNLIDLIDSKIFIYNKELSKMEIDEFTRSFAIGGKIFKHE